MADGFLQGEQEAAGALSPPPETMGARYHISVAQPGRGAHEHLSTPPYLVPSVHYRNGNMERVAPSITLTPLGGMMPGPAMPPPQLDITDYRQPIPDQAGPFTTGIADAWPEGAPVPFRT
jgi:hypothetical protein